MKPDTHGSTGPLLERARLTITRVLTWQLGTALVIAAALALFADQRAAFAAVVGGVIGVVPNCYLAGRMLRRRRSATAEETLRAIYIGEFLKIAFTIALFVIAIKLLNVSFGIVLATYVATVAVNWVALLFVDLGERRGRQGAGLTGIEQAPYNAQQK